ncbi:universal stress protein [Congregibacter litoralis]|uniref:Universal stress protein UspA n=1 Tax=Congregibacter litoralis KT71 TaxID=314285 RepID=A4A435_9GAMM|nr:universal stress protein [Congregibacter litoralis]EAQ99458.1 Universal stress protein UspA [Congregibacter litoralis KT71]
MTISDKEKILACVDQSHFADYVTDYAAWAARRIQAPMELLHIIDIHQTPPSGEDHSGAIGFDAQEQLLSKLSSEDEARTRAARESGRLFLNRLRERASAVGAPQVDTRQRYGQLVETLHEQEAGVQLMVLGRRGESAEATLRDLGRNVESVVRAVNKPILTVTEGFREPERIMFAFDGSAVTRRGVEMIAGSALFRGLPILLLMSGKVNPDGSKKLDWAEKTLTEAGYSVDKRLQPGDAEVVIAKTVTDESIDLLIMGAFSHSPLRTLLFGSKTADLLRSSSIPTLLLG